MRTEQVPPFLFSPSLFCSFFFLRTHRKRKRKRSRRNCGRNQVKLGSLCAFSSDSSWSCELSSNFRGLGTGRRPKWVGLCSNGGSGFGRRWPRPADEQQEELDVREREGHVECARRVPQERPGAGQWPRGRRGGAPVGCHRAAAHLRPHAEGDSDSSGEQWAGHAWRSRCD